VKKEKKDATALDFCSYYSHFHSIIASPCDSFGLSPLLSSPLLSFQQNREESKAGGNSSIEQKKE